MALSGVFIFEYTSIETDMNVYLEFFDSAYKSKSFLLYINSISKEPGYLLLVYFMSKLGVNSSFFVFFHIFFIYYLLLIGAINYLKERVVSPKILYFILVILICNPIFFQLSLNVVRQMFAFTFVFYIISLRINSEFKKISLLSLALLFHTSSILAIIGYILGKLIWKKKRFLKIIIVIIIFSLVTPYLTSLNLYHSKLYEPPKLYLMVIGSLLLIRSYNRFRPDVFFALLFTFIPIFFLYSITEISHRLILIIHFIILFFLIDLLPKFNVLKLFLISFFCIILFILSLNNFLSNFN